MPPWAWGTKVCVPVNPEQQPHRAPPANSDQPKLRLGAWVSATWALPVLHCAAQGLQKLPRRGACRQPGHAVLGAGQGPGRPQRPLTTGEHPHGQSLRPGLPLLLRKLWAEPALGTDCEKQAFQRADSPPGFQTGLRDTHPRDPPCQGAAQHLLGLWDGAVTWSDFRAHALKDAVLGLPVDFYASHFPSFIQLTSLPPPPDTCGADGPHLGWVHLHSHPVHGPPALPEWGYGACGDRTQPAGSTGSLDAPSRGVLQPLSSLKSKAFSSI